MPLSADDFTRLGTTAADALASKGTPLVETIDQLAADNSMSLEQIKRLCEAANNAAFKALFDKSDPTDREVKFDVAKAEDVISRRRGKGSMNSEKTASAPFDAMAELRPLAGMYDGLSKTASAPAEAYVDPVEQKALEKRASQEAFNRIGEAQRLREYLESVCATSRYKIASAVDEIATHFRRLGPDFAPSALDDFEKNAMAVHGEHCLPVLRQVRGLLPYGETSYDVASSAFHAVKHQPALLTMKVASAVVENERVTRAGAILAQPGGVEQAVAAKVGLA